MADRKPLFLSSSGTKSVFQTGDTLGLIHGGTGATTASAARTQLGLVIGTDVQAYDADLAAVAAFSSTGFAVRTGTGAWTPRQILGTSGRITVTNSSGVADNPTFDLATLSDAGTGSFLKITRDAYGRVSGTTAVVTSDLTPLLNSTFVSKSGDTMLGALTLSGAPSSALHAATKQYVDALLGGLGGYTGHTVARAASVGNVNISSPGATIDGVSLINGNVVLLKNQTVGSQNGLYVWNGAAVVMTRHSDYDATGEINPGLFVFISEGTVNGDNGFTLVTDAPITIGSTALSFIQTSGAGQIVEGNGIVKTGNVLSVLTASSSRIVVTGAGVDLPTGVNATGAGTFTSVVVDTYGRVTSGTFSNNISGNAATATALQTARTINGVSFDGTSNISVNTTAAVTFSSLGPGVGVVPGTSFNGSTARTISYNSIGAAPLVSPVFLGIPQADTAALGTASTQLATTQFVQNAVADVTGADSFHIHPAPPPASPDEGDTWLCTDNGILYTYFNDGTSFQWAELGRDVNEGMITSSALPIINPTIPKAGDYRISGGVVEFYLESAWQQVYPPTYSA